MLLKLKQIKDRLNCSLSHAYFLVASGELHCYRIGRGRGGIRVSDEQLAAYLREKEEGGEEPPPDSLRDIKHASASRAVPAGGPASGGSSNNAS